MVAGPREGGWWERRQPSGAYFPQPATATHARAPTSPYPHARWTRRAHTITRGYVASPRVEIYVSQTKHTIMPIRKHELCKVPARLVVVAHHVRLIPRAAARSKGLPTLVDVALR